jgi:hypothetical protein
MKISAFGGGGKTEAALLRQRELMSIIAGRRRAE